MSYPLDKLLEVRRLRRDSAQGELNGRRRDLEQARQERESREKELQNYVDWRNSQCDEFFRSIAETGHRAVEIGQGLDGLRALETKDGEFQRRIKDAQRVEEKACNAAEKALQAYNEASQEVKKLEEHRLTWKKQERIRLERIEENELDDFKTTGHPDSIFAVTEE